VGAGGSYVEVLVELYRSSRASVPSNCVIWYLSLALTAFYTPNVYSVKVIMPSVL